MASRRGLCHSTEVKSPALGRVDAAIVVSVVFVRLGEGLLRLATLPDPPRWVWHSQLTLRLSAPISPFRREVHVFLIDRQARGLSPRTVSFYANKLEPNGARYGASGGTDQIAAARIQPLRIEVHKGYSTEFPSSSA